MKRKMILSIFLLPMPLIAQLPDAAEIMNRSRELSLVGSMSADIHLSITEKSGTSRTRTVTLATKSYPGGLEKRYLKFLDPADVRGTAMLIIDNKDNQDEMWIYLPALKKTRRVVSSDKGKSFMSSEFSNADMSSPSISDFVNNHLDGSGDNDTWIIESIPVNEDKSDEYGYSRKISYIARESSQVLKMEFYNFDNELYKIIGIKGIYPMQNGKFIIRSMTADNLLTGRKSEIDMTNISAGGNVADAIFSLQNLER